MLPWAARKRPISARFGLCPRSGRGNRPPRKLTGGGSGRVPRPSPRAVLSQTNRFGGVFDSDQSDCLAFDKVAVCNRIHLRDTKRHLHLLMPRESRFSARVRRVSSVALSGHRPVTLGYIYLTAVGCRGKPAATCRNSGGADRSGASAFYFSGSRYGPQEFLEIFSWGGGGGGGGASADHGGGLGCFCYLGLACVVWLCLPANVGPICSLVETGCGSRGDPQCPRPAAFTRLGA